MVCLLLVARTLRGCSTVLQCWNGSVWCVCVRGRHVSALAGSHDALSQPRAVAPGTIASALVSLWRADTLSFPTARPSPECGKGVCATLARLCVIAATPPSLQAQYAFIYEMVHRAGSVLFEEAEAAPFVEGMESYDVWSANASERDAEPHSNDANNSCEDAFGDYSDYGQYSDGGREHLDVDKTGSAEGGSADVEGSRAPVRKERRKHYHYHPRRRRRRAKQTWKPSRLSSVSDVNSAEVEDLSEGAFGGDLYSYSYGSDGQEVPRSEAREVDVAVAEDSARGKAEEHLDSNATASPDQTRRRKRRRRKKAPDVGLHAAYSYSYGSDGVMR